MSDWTWWCITHWDAMANSSSQVFTWRLCHLSASKLKGLIENYMMQNLSQARKKLQIDLGDHPKGVEKVCPSI
jgi:hypothetical protein